MKHIKNEMQELGLTNERISSYLIECLVWNIPEQMFSIVIATQGCYSKRYIT